MIRACLEMTPADGHPITFRDGMWCVLSRDRGWVMSRHETLQSAKEWRKKRFVRHFSANLAASEFRSSQFEGREHLVVPVIALVEGVIHASNADTPELVLASELEATAPGWNGEPLMMNHPELQDGVKITANTPEVLDAQCIGRVFNSRVEDKKLKMEAWIDLAKVDRVAGASRLVERIRAGETVEVSVGTFVKTERRAGVFQGKPFQAVWSEIVPDHLAMLPEGLPGACNVEMGCGVRAATKKEEGVEMTRTQRIQAILDNPKVARGNGAISTLLALSEDQLAEYELAAEEGRLEEKDERPWYHRLLGKLLTAGETEEQTGKSDNDIRSMLESVLRPEAGFMGIDSVFTADGKVVYAVMTGESIRLFERDFTIDGEEVKLGKSTKEVVPVTRFEPVAMSATPTAACGCGGQKQAATPAEEGDMEKKERVKALIATGKTPFKEADITALESLSEESLLALEAQAKEPEQKPEPKPEPKKSQTEEEFLSSAPDSIKSIVAQHKAATVARKEQLLAAVKATGQDAFGEDELKAMSVDQLEKVARVAAAKVPPVDNTGRGGPRLEAASQESVPKPPSIVERIRAARGAKGAA